MIDDPHPPQDAAAQDTGPVAARFRALYFLMIVNVVLLAALGIGINQVSGLRDDTRTTVERLRVGCQRNNQVRLAILELAKSEAPARRLEVRRLLEFDAQYNVLVDCKAFYPLP